MAYKYIKAKPCSYGGARNRKNVEYIVIHYTGNNGDTALGNANYFANTNTRNAGAHFFVSQDGTVIKSIAMNLTAWGVGGKYSLSNGAGTYYGKCTNANSVSIELCDNASKDPTSAQIKAVKKLIAYIQTKCPNAQTIIRHWDVNGKGCPARMVGKDNKKWTNFKKKITT